MQILSLVSPCEVSFRQSCDEYLVAGFQFKQFVMEDEMAAVIHVNMMTWWTLELSTNPLEVLLYPRRPVKIAMLERNDHNQWVALRIFAKQTAYWLQSFR